MTINKKIIFIYLVLCQQEAYCAVLAPSALVKKPSTPIKSQHTYPTIPLKKDFGRIIMPVCTSFPLRGDSTIIGKQMLASTENYLKEFRFGSKEEPEKQDRYIVELDKNNRNIGSAALEKIEKMIKKTPIMVGLVGNENFMSLLPDLKKKKLLLLFPFEGDASLRKLNLENVIYFRPSYEKELRALVHYTVKTMHKTEIALLYEASTWGHNLRKTVISLLKEYGVTPVEEASYPQSTVDIDHALKKLSKATPNAIFCLAQPRPAYSFISNAINEGLHESLFLGLSHLCVIQKLLKIARGLDIAVTSVVPNTQTSNLPLVQEYKVVMKNFLSFRDDSPIYLEAFITMALFDECLRRTARPATINGIIKTIENFKNLNLKGLKINFDPTDRSLSSALWINPGFNKQWILVKPYGVADGQED